MAATFGGFLTLLRGGCPEEQPALDTERRAIHRVAYMPLDTHSAQPTPWRHKERSKIDEID